MHRQHNNSNNSNSNNNNATCCGCVCCKRNTSLLMLLNISGFMFALVNIGIGMSYVFDTASIVSLSSSEQHQQQHVHRGYSSSSAIRKPWTVSFSASNQKVMTTTTTTNNNNNNVTASEATTTTTSASAGVTGVMVSDPNKKKLHLCGWHRGKLVDYLFPEYQGNHHLLRVRSTSHQDSILAFGLFRPCTQRRGKVKHVMNLDWIKDHYRGKTVTFNGEGSKGNRVPDYENFYHIGLRPDSSHTVHVIFLAQALIGEYVEDDWKKIFHHSLKPQSTRKYFCIYATSNCIKYRDNAADTISDQIGMVDQGGPCRGRKGNKLREIIRQGNETSWRNNQVLFHDYRFCLVMENEHAYGYITEKILNAFLGGCIPIYYGTEEIFQIFNPRSFVYYDIADPQPALELIRMLEHNETAYLQVLQEEHILANDEVIDKYFSLADHIGNGTLKRKIRTMMGLPP